MGLAPHIWVPDRTIIPPSPPAQNRIEHRKQIERETCTYTGRVLLPGSEAYYRDMACIGAGLLFPGLAAARRQVTTAPAGGGGLPSATPSAFYRLEDESDSVGANNLTNLNTVTFNTGHIGNAAYFGGTTQRLTVNSAAPFVIADLHFCVWGWGYLVSNTGASPQSFVSKWIFSTAREYFVNASQENPTRLNVNVNGSAPTSVTAATFGGLPQATWFFFAFRHNPDTNFIQVSINGGSWDQTALSGGVANLSAPFMIGTSRNGTNNLWPLNGRVDAVATFANTAVSDADVVAGYNSGTGCEYYSGAWH